METASMMPFRRQSGFTLQEIVVAMGLFAIGVLGLCKMTSGLMSNNTAARNRADATRLARNALETLGQSEYSEIGQRLDEALDPSGVSGDGIFQREVVVDEKASPVFKEVTVTVSWGAKGAHRVVLKTVFAP